MRECFNIYATLYPNPYMVVTAKGYTKHYYAGTERLATVIGRGGFGDRIVPIEELSPSEESTIIKPFYNAYKGYDPFLHADVLQKPLTAIDITGQEFGILAKPVIVEIVDVHAKEDILLGSIKHNAFINAEEGTVFFTHSDHLGSAAWITNENGKCIQYIHYAPFGELMDNQRVGSYDERFKFTGKERDEESGYDYFGARYYTSNLSMWLSVDPLADKYPNISPYAYCAWNPMKYVDPDGRDAKMIVSGSTITLQATYYVRPTDIKSVTQAVKFWNDQTALLYTDNKGNTYSVRFDLSIKTTDNPRNTANLEGAYANSYEVVQQLSAETSTQGAKAIGLTKDNRSIEVRSDKSDGLTGAHEVGHTLMNVDTKDGEHSSSGIMTRSANDPQHSEYVSQETVNTIIESHKSNSLWSRIKSLFE